MMSRGSASQFPFPRTDVSSDFSDGHSESGEAVQHGLAHLELGDLTVEAPSGQTLAQQFDAVHLGTKGLISEGAVCQIEIDTDMTTLS